MSDVSGALRAQVISRAGERCEYCGLAQQNQEATFHIDHVVPRVAGGPTTYENLALACVSCSLRKSAKQTGIDPDSGQDAPLFNPRIQVWAEHFRFEGELIVPVTATGRATVSALAMNRPLIVAIRLGRVRQIGRSYRLGEGDLPRRFDNQVTDYNALRI